MAWALAWPMPLSSRWRVEASAVFRLVWGCSVAVGATIGTGSLGALGAALAENERPANSGSRR